MQITFERSGGLAGIILRHVVNTEDLPSAELDRVNKLVEQAKFFDLPRSLPAATPQADRFQYKISLKQGSQRKTVTVSDQAVPPSLKPLLDYLTTRARG